MVKVSQFMKDINNYDLYSSLDDDILINGFHYANGCGAKGGKKFPNKFLWVSIISACIIHDIEWALSANFLDLKVANENFDNNLKKICDTESNWFTRPLRRRFIGYYITGVELYGTPQYARERGFI